MVNRRQTDRAKDRGTGFTYRARDPKKLKERSEQQGGTFDSIFKSSVQSWRPAQGDNVIRILPPSWEGAEHYGYEIFVHSYVGADKSTYVCPKKMIGKRCPICAAASEMRAAGEEEDAKKLSVKKQVLVYIIERGGDDELQPKVWAMSWTMDRDIAALAWNKTTGKILEIDRPKNGYDVLFKRTGQQLNTRYVGLQIDRDSRPIHDDSGDRQEVLDYIAENPLDGVLKIYDEDYLAKVVEGTTEAKDDDMDDEDDEKPRRKRARARDDDADDEAPKRSRRGRDDDDADDETPKRARRTARDDDDGDDEPPKKRRARDDDDADDEPPKKRRARDDDDGDDEPPKRVGRRARDDDDADDEPPKKRRARDDDDADDEPPKKRRASRDDDDGDDEPPKKRRARDDDDGDDDAPPKKRRARDDDDGDDEPPKSRRRARDDDDADPEEDPADDDGDDPEEDARSTSRSRRSRDDDDDKPKAAKRVRRK